MTISKDDTVILDGAGDKKAIEERCDQVCAVLHLLSILFFSIKNNSSFTNKASSVLVRHHSLGERAWNQVLDDCAIVSFT